jgi:hypothetical protein
MACEPRQRAIDGRFIRSRRMRFLRENSFIHRMGFGLSFVTKGFSSKERNTYA